MKKTITLILFGSLLLVSLIRVSALNTPTEGIFGELKCWHRVTVAFEGPELSEASVPNPFTDFRLNVIFSHAESGKSYRVPGYFAADGNAGETGATSGFIWRAHFAPDEVGEWTYVAEMRTGENIAISVDPLAGEAVGLNGNIEEEARGRFYVWESNKGWPDNRGRGRLQYVGKHYLQYAQSGEYFIKQGPDSPENLLAYADFDGDFKTDGNYDKYIKTFAPHVNDWKSGDPSWGDGKGRGLIGAINYLASEGLNVFSFLTMNVTGDDRNVYPYTTYDERLRMDVSRLDQWEVVLEHADSLGFYLHFKTQEEENATLLDGGDVGLERKIYYRELIARFSHHLALNWNLGEENDHQSTEQRQQMAQYFADTDPYGHLIVVHTFPHRKEEVYVPLLGEASSLTGVSLQGASDFFEDVHGDVHRWVKASGEAGKPWVVGYDEPGNWKEGLVPDDVGFEAGNGNYKAARHRALWGSLMAGGAGVEWFFGEGNHDGDVSLEDFRSRDKWWDYCRVALRFFRNYLPFERMQAADELIQNVEEGYCFASTDDVYALYLPSGTASGKSLDLSAASGAFVVSWFDPRNGGFLAQGSVTQVLGGGEKPVELGNPPSDLEQDWVALVQRSRGRIAYIYGDVSFCGDMPSGKKKPFQQMLLTDSGKEGLSEFKEMVEAEGFQIDQYYDRKTKLNSRFLSQFDVIIFGLHQKQWSKSERRALDTWLRQGGGMFVYSDSGAGGHWEAVDPQNAVGQRVVNSLIAPYGMEVTVDQANGIKAFRSGLGERHPIVWDRLVLEGEGVSPIAVDQQKAWALIPYNASDYFRVSGDPVIAHQENLTIKNPQFAALAQSNVEKGTVIAMFDRQPMWNNGPGSDINKRDNKELLRRIMDYLAKDR